MRSMVFISLRITQHITILHIPIMMTDTSLAGQLLHLIHPISTIYFCPSSSSSACLSGHCHQPVPILTASVPENAGIRILLRFRPCHAPASSLSSTSVSPALVSSASSFGSLLSDPRLVASSGDRKITPKVYTNVHHVQLTTCSTDERVQGANS